MKELIDAAEAVLRTDAGLRALGLFAIAMTAGGAFAIYAWIRALLIGLQAEAYQRGFEDGRRK